MQRGRGKFGRNNDRTTNGRRKNKAFNGRNNRGRDKKIIPCYTCGKYGHYANQFTQNSNEEKVLKLIEKEKKDNNINNNNSKNITENNITKKVKSDTVACIIPCDKFDDFDNIINNVDFNHEDNHLYYTNNIDTNMCNKSTTNEKVLAAGTNLTKYE